MPHIGLVRSILAAALATTALAAPQANAGQKVIVVTPPAQLQIERDRAEARQFQLRQQLDREQDRRMYSRPQPNPNVPMMRSTCTPTNGVSCN
jgi:Ni/Co efflux regulator RcnB